MITVNLDKARGIAHEWRRSARAEEFRPLDQQVNINIANPVKLAEIESGREAIREKYAAVQGDIDAAGDIADLKAIVDSLSD